MSHLFLRTLRDDPADAEVPSHRLLVRAGYVRRIAPGVFAWLPLGYRVLRKIEQIVREEMDAMGAQEVHLPALLPREPYELTGRWEEYGPTLFRLHDRRDTDYLLGPTHEEIFTQLVKGEYSSYKDLPTVLYQIQTKYRDEARPRAGILRGREFVMKDSYSFDLDDAGLASSYGAHRVAYQRIFERLGLDYVIVSAQSGAMGGSASEEFLAPCVVGEDTFASCAACGYAANAEAVTVAPLPADAAAATDRTSPVVEATPNCATITDLVDYVRTHVDNPHLGALGRDFEARDTLKNVLFAVDAPDGSTEVIAIGVPGDREIDVKRLEAWASPAVPRPLSAEEFDAYPHLVPGYIGPRTLGQTNGTPIRYLLDPRVATGSTWVSGADRRDHHEFGLVAGHDFRSDGVIDVAEIRAGDPCPTCGQGLQIDRGIEIGHIFQLGRKYAEALDLRVQNESGTLQVVTMGSYGVGVSRAVAAIAEQRHDGDGLVWPIAVAPAHVHIVAAGKGDEVQAAARGIAHELSGAGVEVILDDRSASPGVKFKDAELLGVPLILVVGRGLADGVVELKDRATGERTDVPVESAATAVEHAIEVLRAGSVGRLIGGHD